MQIVWRKLRVSLSSGSDCAVLGSRSTLAILCGASAFSMDGNNEGVIAISLACTEQSTSLLSIAEITTVGRNAASERAFLGRTTGAKTSRIAVCSICPIWTASVESRAVNAMAHGSGTEGSPLGCNWTADPFAHTETSNEQQLRGSQPIKASHVADVSVCLLCHADGQPHRIGTSASNAAPACKPPMLLHQLGRPIGACSNRCVLAHVTWC